jgi:hypothetical protein
MDGSAVADLKSVVAPLNFLVPMAESRLHTITRHLTECRSGPAKVKSIG